MQEAYICRTIHGQVIVFARCDQEVRIYLPDEIGQEHMKISLEKWEKTKKSYRDSKEISDYNDVINAAWQCLGIRNPINKAKG
jgi:hypothetical protein